MGYLIMERGSEADPIQIRAIDYMTHPSSVKEGQKLTGTLAALSRFVSRYSNKTQPSFSVIKKGSKFE